MFSLKFIEDLESVNEIKKEKITAIWLFRNISKQRVSMVITWRLFYRRFFRERWDSDLHLPNRTTKVQKFNETCQQARTLVDIAKQPTNVYAMCLS